MATTIPPDVLVAPDPGELRYGLFTVARPQDMTARQRQAGLIYDPVGCGTSRSYPAICDETPPTKTIDANTGETTVAPFVIYASLLCGSAGYSMGYLENKVRQKLLATEQTGVEAEFATGLNGGLPILQAGAGVVNLGAATGLIAGVSMLEAYAAANYGYPGVIHAPASINAYASVVGLARTVGNDPVIRTQMKTAWVFGGGYTGASPAGVAAVAGHVWLYITGKVNAWRSPDIFVTPGRSALNRSTNQITMFAEREWAVTYDCFVAAVDVTLT